MTLAQGIASTLAASEAAIAATLPAGRTRATVRTLARWHCCYLLVKDDPASARAIVAALQVYCAAQGLDPTLVGRVLGRDADCESDALSTSPPTGTGPATGPHGGQTDTK